MLIYLLNSNKSIKLYLLGGIILKNDKASFNWFPGHMNKAIKEIQEKIPVVDLVMEIVDARAPFSTQNPVFRKILSKRPRLVILSKGDLADDEVTIKWINYYQKNGDRCFLVKDKQIKIFGEIQNLIEIMTLEKQKKDIARGIEKPNLNVLVVGIPNVGKSSIIQRLTKGKQLKIGNKPGVTRGQQRINMTEKITLIDTPGILPGKFENETIGCTCAATNSVKLDVVPKERFASKILKYLYNNYPNLIETKYKISTSIARPIDYDDTYKIFEAIARRMNFCILEDLFDVEKSIALFIHDLYANNFGKISFERPIEITTTSTVDMDEVDIDFTMESDATIEW